MAATARFHDRYGLPLSTDSAQAAEHYIDAVDRLLASNPGAEEALSAALALDPDFALARVARARELQFRGRAAEAREEVRRARDIAARLTPREQGHIDAIATAVEGDSPGALLRVRAHLQDYPRDAFVLSQASGVYGLIGFSGRQDRNQEQLALMESVAEAYGEDWWFLSALAFAYNELFQTERARPLAARSIEIYPRNGHAAHTVAHVEYESGRIADGSTFLEGWLPAYDRAAGLHCHLSWHLALFHLRLGNQERVLDLFTSAIAPDASIGSPLGTLADSASLLWRGTLDGGLPQSLPWACVREHAAIAFPRAGGVWADLHSALAYAGAGDRESLDRLVAELEARETQGKQYAGPVVAALARGIAAYAAEDWTTVISEIEPYADQIVRIGGSNAQREGFEDTLIEAYLRAGRAVSAEALLLRRLERRPSTYDERRLQRAGVATARGSTS